MNYPTHIQSIFINLKEANFCMYWCQSLSKMPKSSVFKKGVLKVCNSKRLECFEVKKLFVCLWLILHQRNHANNLYN